MTTALSTTALDVRRAWLSLLLFPLAFLAAFGVGEGLASLLGHPPGGDEVAPWWVVLGATVPALLAFSVPAVLAWHFGRRALRAGDSRGRAPLVVGAVVAAGFVGLNLASYVVGLLS